MNQLCLKMTSGSTDKELLLHRGGLISNLSSKYFNQLLPAPSLALAMASCRERSFYTKAFKIIKFNSLSKEGLDQLPVRLFLQKR